MPRPPLPEEAVKAVADFLETLCIADSPRYDREVAECYAPQVLQPAQPAIEQAAIERFKERLRVALMEAALSDGAIKAAGDAAIEEAAHMGLHAAARTNAAQAICRCTGKTILAVIGAAISAASEEDGP